MADVLLHARDRAGERTLRLPEDAVLAVLATARDSTDSLRELLQEANRYDARISLATLDEALAENDDPNAPYRIDLVDRVIAYPVDDVDFSMRGVLERRDESGRETNEYETFQIGRKFRLVDSDRNHGIDGKTLVRSEKALWAGILPENVEDAPGYRIDGVDFDGELLRDIYVWTVTEDERPPEVNEKSVYELTIEGSRHATVMGQTHDEGTRHKGQDR